MVTLSLSDSHAEALKRLADEAGVTADELLGEWIARFGASDPKGLSRDEVDLIPMKYFHRADRGWCVNSTKIRSGNQEHITR